jgi:hypothetical protein
MGYLIYSATEKSPARPGWGILALYLLAANAPDMDFIPGMLIGEPGRYRDCAIG